MVSRITGFPSGTPPPSAPKAPPAAHVNPGVPTAMVHFTVHPGMPEVLKHAQQQRWLEQGFTALSVAWSEMHYTTDRWATFRVCKSSDVPCPVINGWYYLSHVRAGEEVEFAVQAGIDCRAPADMAGFREQAALWFNNDGQNYKQIAR